MSLPTKPQSRVENYLGVIVGQESAVLPQNPQSRVEDYLDYVAKNGIGGGGSKAYLTFPEMIRAINAMSQTQMKAGQGLFIQDTTAPAMWVSVVDTTHSEYTYTTREAFLNEMKTNGYVKVGYYLISLVNAGVDPTLETDVAALKTDMTNVKGLIPTTASAQNQLATRDFVNSSVQTATANYRGAWETWDSIPTNVEDYPQDYSGTKKPSVNDYLVLVDMSTYPGALGRKGTYRFKYAGNWDVLGKNGWLPEYMVNEEPLTAAQIAALNSGITAEIVQKIQQGTGISEDIWDLGSAITEIYDWQGNLTWEKAQWVTSSKTNPVSVSRRKRLSRPLKWGRNISSVKAFGNHTKRKRPVLWGQYIPAQPSGDTNPISLKNLLNDANVVTAYNANGNYVYQGHFSSAYNLYTASKKYRTLHLNLKAGSYKFFTDTPNAHVLRYSIDDVITSAGGGSSLSITLDNDAEFQICWRNTSTSEFSGEHSAIYEGSYAPIYTAYNDLYCFVKNVGADGTGTGFGYFNEQTKDFIPVSGASGTLIQPVSSITSTATAFIDTGIRPADCDVVEADVKFLGTTSARSLMGFSSDQGRYFGKDANGAFELGAGVAITPPPSATDRHIAVLDMTNKYRTKLTVDGKSCERVSVTTQDQTSTFKTIVYGNVGDGNITYGLKMLSADVPVVDLISVRVNTTAYMYDYVSGTLFANAGTGAFTYGSDIPYIQLAPEDIVVPKGVLYVGYETPKTITQWYYPDFPWEYSDEGDHYRIYPNFVEPTSGPGISVSYSGIKGHKCLMTAYVKGTRVCILPKYFEYSGRAADVTSPDAFAELSAVFTMDAYRDTIGVSTIEAEYSVKKDIKLWDLTEIFGAGNEPSTVAAAKAALSKITADGEHKVAVFEDGMNLFDKTAVKAGYYLDITGAEIANAIWNISDYMPVVGGATYYQYLTNAGTSPKIGWYDADKQFISAVTQKARGTQTAPANARYCRMSIINQSTGTQDLDVAMFTIGSTAPTTYVPYVAPTEIDIPMLLSDESFVEIQTGDRTEPWGAALLTGAPNEKWTMHATLKGLFFHTLTNEGALVQPTADNYGECACAEAVRETAGNIDMGECCFNALSATTPARFALRLPFDSVDELKAYLAEHNAIILFPLAAPVTDTVEVEPIEPDDSIALTIVGEAEIPVTEQAKYIG